MRFVNCIKTMRAKPTHSLQAPTHNVAECLHKKIRIYRQSCHIGRIN